MLEADFEIGEAFRHQIIPRAVLYFTGDALAYSDYDEEEDEDEEFDAEEESDDDNPQETSPRKPAHKKGHQGGKPHPGAGAGQEQPPECKQQ